MMSLTHLGMSHTLKMNEANANMCVQIKEYIITASEKRGSPS